MHDSTTSQPTSRATLMPMAVAAGVLPFVLILFLTPSSPWLTEAAARLDVGILTLLNGLARRSWRFDVLVWEVEHNFLLQGVMVALFWAAWFSTSDTSADQRKRETLLSTLIGVYATAVLAIVFRVVLPFRARPRVEPGIVFHVPYLPPDGTLGAASSTSLPAGHAAVFLAVAVGLWSISVVLGLLGLLHALLVICLPRVYFGLHYPSDILAGAVVALVTVPLINEMFRRGSLMRHVLAWSERYPRPFYGLFFLCSLDIALEFSSARTVLYFVGGGQLKRLVMLTIGVVVPS